MEKRILHTQAYPVLASSRERLREAAKTFFAERGYEATPTMEICRLAGTSQSQLIKHFINKQGLLEAVFEYAWEQINPAIRLAVQSIPAPRDKLQILVDMLLNFLEKDPPLRALFLLEGRRIRNDGRMSALVPGFLEFVKTLDGILKEMAAQGELVPGLDPQALRSALMGAVEGMLRDQMLARKSRFPASFSEVDMRAVFSAVVSSCLRK